MAKTIAFLISSTNEVGDPPARPLTAYALEAERDIAWEGRRNKNDSRIVRDEVIVDLDEIREQIQKKLSPIELLALGFKQREIFRK